MDSVPKPGLWVLPDDNPCKYQFIYTCRMPTLQGACSYRMAVQLNHFCAEADGSCQQTQGEEDGELAGGAADGGTAARGCGAPLLLSVDEASAAVCGAMSEGVQGEATLASQLGCAGAAVSVHPNLLKTDAPSPL